MQGIFAAFFEAVSETVLLFSGWILFPPEISLFLRNGMFITPTILALMFRLYRNRTVFSFNSRRQGYHNVGEVDPNDPNDANADEVDPNDANADEVDPNDANADEVDLNDASANEVDPNGANANEIDPNDANADEIDPNDANANEIDPNDANADKVDLNDASANEVDPNGANANEIDPNDANADVVDPNNNNDDTNSVDSLEDCKHKKRCHILNTFLQVAGWLLQLVGMVLVYTFIGFDMKKAAPVMTWVVLGLTAVFSLALSAIWTGNFQKMLTIANVTNLSPHAKKHDPTARWKASKYIATIQRFIKFLFVCRLHWSYSEVTTLPIGFLFDFSIYIPFEFGN